MKTPNKLQHESTSLNPHSTVISAPKTNKQKMQKKRVYRKIAVCAVGVT